MTLMERPVLEIRGALFLCQPATLSCLRLRSLERIILYDTITFGFSASDNLVYRYKYWVVPQLYVRGVDLAVHAGFAGANPYSRSLIERIRLSKETHWRRLLIWCAVVVASSVAVGIVLPKGLYLPSRVLLAATYTIAATTGFGASVYCLSIFALERRLGSLLAATAFSVMGAGTVLQAAVDLQGSPPAAYGWIAAIALMVAALLLVGEAHSTSRWRAANRLQSIGQFVIAGMAVIAFPLVTTPYVLDTSMLNGFSSSVSAASVCRIVDAALGVSTALLMCWALIANSRRYLANSDGLAGLVCYYLAACAVGLLFCSACGERFDRWYTMGQVCFVWSWLALMVGNGIENAFAHKEARDRLEELEALHDVSWSLVGAGTVGELLEMFVSTIVNKLGAGIAAVYLADGAERLELAAICGSEEAKPGTKYPLVASGPFPGFHSGHTVKAHTSKQVQVAHDVFVDVEFVPWRVVAGDDGCAASIPLVDGDDGIGVLNVYFSDARQLTIARLRLLATIAAAGTSAIQYAMSKQSTPASDVSELDIAA